MIKEKESVEVIIRDLETNPKCQHGPTILFSSKNRKYFSCSSNRTKNKCFYLDFDQFERNKDVILHGNDRTIKQHYLKEALDLRKLPVSERYFCPKCNEFVTVKSLKSHISHGGTKHINDEILTQPSLFLPQLDNDKVNAQYFFDDSTLNFINLVFDELKLNRIICMGAPRLHDFLRNKVPKKSILLDIDERFQPFYPEEFCRYNMFNNFFFNGKCDEDKLIEFLKNDNENENSQCCLFTDPPFAARTELLSQTIKTMSSLYYRLNHKILPVFWIFPYFNEHHIQKFMPEMEMMDFRVTYMNHHAFNNEYKGRKEGSIVRIFTNIPQNIIKYPPTLVDYRYCKPCNRFVAQSNIHCNICRICPSKNGATYRHCDLCIKCVKKNYHHCENCGRCVQKSSHDCKIFQKHQECWFCHEKGHVEKFCKFMKKIKKKGRNGRCIVCNLAHNLSQCSEKNKRKN